MDIHFFYCIWNKSLPAHEESRMQFVLQVMLKNIPNNAVHKMYQEGKKWPVITKLFIKMY